MAPLLPQIPRFKLRQKRTAVGFAEVDTLDAFIILLSETAFQKPWPDFPYAARLKSHLLPGNDVPPPQRRDLPNAQGTAAVLTFVKQHVSTFELLTLARKTIAAVLEVRPRNIGLIAPGMPATDQARVADAVVAALAAGTFQPPRFKTSEGPTTTVQSLTLFGVVQPIDFRRTLAAAEGNGLVRWLTLLPANTLTPTGYRRRLKALAEREGWKFEFLDERKLKTLKAGAFLAISQGSEDRRAGIAHLCYRPAKAGKDRRAIALVGKGICYDTGGVNLKSAKSMFGMHGDMQGSAVALGTLLALTRLKVPRPVDCWLAITRNRIGPRAYTQNEVVTAANGVTIEIVHTDAEGRMVLADTLVLASKARPALLLDYATLTGSCITALGTRYSGIFCNHPELRELATKAGAESGERVWPLPVDADYDEALASDVADVKQCNLESEADHILAARFLARFVRTEVRWIHVDLSSAEHKGGLAHVPGDITGFGVRFSLNLLLDQRWT